MHVDQNSSSAFLFCLEQKDKTGPYLSSFQYHNVAGLNAVLFKASSLQESQYNFYMEI